MHLPFLGEQLFLRLFRVGLEFVRILGKPFLVLRCMRIREFCVVRNLS